MRFRHGPLFLLVALVPGPVATAQIQETLLVLNKAEATASLLDPASGEVRATVAVGDGPHEIAVSPDGRTAVASNYGGRVDGSTLTVIDVAAGTATRTFALRQDEADDKLFLRPHGIAFLPDGQHVAVTAERQRRLLLIDLEHAKVVAAIPTEANASHMVAVDGAATMAYVANIQSGSVSVIDLVEQKLRQVVATDAGAEGIAVHPTRPECWVTNRAADTVSVIDTGSLAVVATIDCGSFPIRVAFTRDGAHALVSNARSGAVAVIDVVTREIVRQIAMDEAAADSGEERLFGDQFGQSPVPIGILVRPDGKRAYVANAQADVITVIDLTEWTVVQRLRAGKEPDGMAWSVIRGSEAKERRQM